MYFADGQEHFEYDPCGMESSAATHKTYPYLESLLSFLDLDCAQLERQLEEIIAIWERFFSTGESVFADDAMQRMGSLAARHIYFQLPYLQWFARKAEESLTPDMVAELHRLLEQLPVSQRQAQIFSEKVLDIDLVGRDTKRNTRIQYLFERPRDPSLFRFQTIPVSFGPVGSEACGPILLPDSIRDIIDFSLRECVTSGIPVRRCRSCGRYFPLTGRVMAEYCERPNPDRKPYRNTAAVQKWTESRSEDLVFKEYRREYKRHFAWIKAGKLSAEEFAAWSKQAQVKKKECDNGEISLEEFKAWLKNF